MNGLDQDELDRRRRHLRWFADGGAILAMALSTAVLLLWGLHVNAAEATMPHLFEMKANTALGFVAAGAALFLLVRGRRGTVALAAIPVAIGLLTLLEYVAGISLHIDELLLTDWSAGANGFPGRPSPNAALALVALGFALILLAVVQPGRTRRVAVKSICFAVIAVAMAAIAGYVADAPFAVGWGSLRVMAIPSAMCALAVGAGTMAYAWQSEIGAVARIPVWIPALLCFLIVLIDIDTQREIAAGILYIPLVFCALWFERPHVSIIFASLSTLLIVLGHFASPPGTAPEWVGLVNRSLAILGVWTVAILVYLQRRAQRKLQQNAQHLAAAQEIASVGSFELRFSTMAFSSSSGFDAMHGLRSNGNRDWESFILHSVPPDDRPRIERMIEEARRGVRSGKLEYSFLRSDGAGRNAIIHYDLLFSDEGSPAGIIGVVHDVTELKQAEAREADIEGQLRHAQKLEALGTLAGGIAHDLNNMLVPITTLVPFMIESCEDPADRRSLEIIMGSARRGKELVRQILAFSRKDPAEREAIRLDLLAKDALTMIRAGVPASIAIVDALEPVPEMVGSKGQLYQTILNLATNAAQAIGDRAGTITIGATHGPLEEGATGVRLYVTDDGAGMDEATMARIFEPFFSTKGTRNGTGLGLSIVSGIVTSHGGSISVESEPGKGTRFDLLFPSGDVRSAA